MESKIRNINAAKPPTPPSPKPPRPKPTHRNQKVESAFANLGNGTQINLYSQSLTDQDMEIVAYELENNTVSAHLWTI